MARERGLEEHVPGVPLASSRVFINGVWSERLYDVGVIECQLDRLAERLAHEVSDVLRKT